MIIETPERVNKRSHRSNEGKIQSECVIWFHNTFPQYRGLLFHVPNENDRADSSPIQGAIRKSLGVWPGVADLIFLVPRGPHGALLIEMKDEKGTQKPAQKEWQKIVEAHGYSYKICRSLAQFKEILYEYLGK
ncbi:MAG: VRR-NUC domain-containing protein [Bacteroidales bacterium]|nr:VRR-NUC domain-containing protein [Bacteroidales bacterium]